MNVQRSLGVACLSVVAVLALACGGPGASPGATNTLAPTAASSASPSGGGSTTVAVTLQEFSVLPAVATAHSGAITFTVTNTGPDDVHEFVIVRTDLAPNALPTDGTGAVEEETDGLEVIDEIEDIAVGATAEVTATLEPGAYVLICNIYAEDEQEAHYQMGMYAAFTVTE